MVVLQIAADGHFASAVATRHTPFAPVIGVYAPGREVVAVGGYLDLVADHVGAVDAHAPLVVHGGVCAWPDVREPQRRLRCGA